MIAAPETPNKEIRSSSIFTAADSFQLGAPVWVKRRGQPLSQGKIAYLGPVHFAEGDDWVGVELVGASASHGKNNGTIQGRTYFHTSASSPFSGIFVRKAQLSFRTTVVKAVSSPISFRCQSPTTPKTNKSGVKSPAAIFRDSHNKNNNETSEQRKRRESLKQWKLKLSSRRGEKHKSEPEPDARKPLFRRAASPKRSHPLLGLSISFSTTETAATTAENCNTFVDYSEPFSYETLETGEEEEIEFDERTGTSTIETLETKHRSRQRDADAEHVNNSNDKRPLFAFDENVAPLPQKTSWEHEESLRRERLEALERWKRERKLRSQNNGDAVVEPGKHQRHPMRLSFQAPKHKNSSAAHRRTRSSVETPSSKPAGLALPPLESLENTKDGRKKQTNSLIHEPQTPETAPSSMLAMEDNEETIELFAESEETGRASLAAGTEFSPLWMQRAKDNAVPDILPALEDGEASESNQSSADRGLGALRNDLAQAQEVYDRTAGCSNLELQHDLDAILESNPNENNKNHEMHHVPASAQLPKRKVGSKPVTQKSCLHSLMLILGIFFTVLVYLTVFDDTTSQVGVDEEVEETKGNSHGKKKKKKEKKEQNQNTTTLPGKILGSPKPRDRGSFERTTNKQNKRRSSNECFVHCATCTCTRAPASFASSGKS